MDFDIYIGETHIELRDIEKAKLNLTFKSVKDANGKKAIVPQELRGGTILGTHELEDGVHADSKVVYILEDGKFLEKLGTVTVGSDQITF